MLGLVFTEFVECVETGYGYGLADQVQQSCPFHTNFTAIDIYDHQKLLVMVTKLHEATGVPVEQLVLGFGKHIFATFVRTRPDAFTGVHSTKQLLQKVEEVIHADVRSIYPEAELPQFQFPDCAPGEFRIEYQSTRPFALLAQGMLEASISHFHESAQITRLDLDGPPGTHALFVLQSEPSEPSEPAA